MKSKDKLLTNSPINEHISIQNDDKFPNAKNIPGDSVEDHKELEQANAILTGDEIKQQNENL